MFLLDKTLFIIGELEGNAPLSIRDDLLIDTLENGGGHYGFNVSTTHPLASSLLVGHYLVFNDEAANRLFRITESIPVDGMSNTMHIDAVDASRELADIVCFPTTTALSKTLTAHATDLLNESGWEVGVIDSAIDTSKSIRFTNYEHGLDRLNLLTKLYDAETRASVTLNSTNVTSKKIDFVKRRGQDLDEGFVYTPDFSLGPIQRTADETNIVTAIVGIGKTDANGEDVSFKSLVYDDENFYTPANDRTLYSRSALARWGRENGHIRGTYRFDTSNPQELLAQTIINLRANINPRVLYELSAEELMRRIPTSRRPVLGDTVQVFDKSYSPTLTVETRIIEIRRPFFPSNGQGTIVVLANYRPDNTDLSKELDKIRDRLLQKEATWDFMGDSITVSPTAPTKATAGDFWLDITTTPPVLKYFESGSWKKATIDKEYVDEKIPYLTRIVSSNGDVFKNGDISAILSVVVFKGRENITNTLPDSSFHWRKIRRDGTPDLAWNAAHVGYGKTLAVTPADVDAKVTFEVDLDL